MGFHSKLLHLDVVLIQGPVGDGGIVLLAGLMESIRRLGAWRDRRGGGWWSCGGGGGGGEKCTVG